MNVINTAVFPTRVGMYRVDVLISSSFSVFPTRVGMYRAPRFRSIAIASFPHTRGDVP